MKFGTYHTFQVPPWTTTGQVYDEELERVHLAEELGYDSVWVAEQHFFDYCACPDALDMVAYLLGETSRVRVGAAVVNMSLTHPLRLAERAAMLDRLLHRSVVLNLDGDSYRLRDHHARNDNHHQALTGTRTPLR